MENNKLETAILQISTEERAVNYQWEKDADKLDKRISIVSMDDIKKMKDSGWSFEPDISFLCEGMTLALHPFYLTNAILILTIAEDELFKDKFNCLGRGL